MSIQSQAQFITFLLLSYSHTGPARPLWLHTWTLPESCPRLRAQKAAFRLAVEKEQNVYGVFSISERWCSYLKWFSSFLPEQHQYSWWGPEAPEGSCSCQTATSQWLPHTSPGTRRMCLMRCYLSGHVWNSQLVKGERRTREGGRGLRWQTWTLGGICIEAGDGARSGEPSQTGVHRLHRETRDHDGVLAEVQKVDSDSVCINVCVCVLTVPCFWCWSHCFASCCCCGASWLSGTSFTMTTASSPSSPADLHRHRPQC